MPVNLLNEKDLNNYLADIVYHGQEIEVFKSGDFKSVAFVEQNKDAIVRSMLLQWFKHRLRSHLAEDLPEHRDFLTPIATNEPNLPAWAERCLSEGKPIHRFEADKIPANLTENINMVRDYLYSAAESYVNKTLARVKDTNTKGEEEVSPKLRIDYLKTQDAYDTFAKTLEEAEKWHNIMAQKAELRKRNEEMYLASLPGTRSVMKLDEGMEIVQLTTPKALDYESEYMGHCVGQGNYDKGVMRGNIKIYSLRDADGMPHATIEVRVNKKTGEEEIYQCKGKGNRAPVERYRPYIRKFVKKKDFNIVNDLRNIGLIKLYDEETGASDFYDINNIPTGKKLICKGNLDLSGIGLTELPDLSNITVEGNFFCFRNELTSLKGAPKKVGGSFQCQSNPLTSLEGAPQAVGGDFDCSCTNITSLEGAPKTVGGNFDCGRTEITSLKGVPQTVGGGFKCNYTKLASLEGAPQNVNGIFDCSETLITSLEGGPQTVSGEFACYHTQITSLKGAPRTVGGRFFCSGSEITSLEGAPEKVGGDFDCSYTNITSLKGATQEVGKSFYCKNTPITSLQYAPKTVQNFDCSDTQITSLEFAPQKVTGYFDCSYTAITSLEGVPQKITGYFDCSHTQITSLKGAPQNVDRNFDCSHTQITSLEGAPQKVGGNFDCAHTQITSLEGAPKTVGEDFYCNNTPLTSLEGAPKKVGESFKCYDTKITSLEHIPVCETIVCNHEIYKKYGFDDVNGSLLYSQLMKKTLHSKNMALRYKIKRNEAAKNVSPNKNEVKPKRTNIRKIAAKMNIIFAHLEQLIKK